jgi:predicted lipoprotein with Yx(FWY)xxD motif
MTKTSQRGEGGGPGPAHRQSRFVLPTVTRIGFCALTLALALGWIIGINKPSSASPASGVGGEMLAGATSTVQAASNATYGEILTTGAGLALYSLNTDQGGQSTCTGACAAAWPALTVPSGTTPTAGSGVTGALATAEQSNGTLQVTYHGLLLYTFAGDTPGQVTGQGENGFSVVILAAVTTTPTAPTTTTTTPPTSATPTSTSTTTSTTSIPSSSVGLTTTTTSPVAAVVSSPSSAGNTGSASSTLATTGAGDDIWVLIAVGVTMSAIGALGRRHFTGFARWTRRSRVQ